MTKEDVKRLKKSWHERKRQNDLSPEWQSFNAYLKWAEENGFGAGDRIHKINAALPAGPGNCRLYDRGGAGRPTEKEAEKTNPNMTIEYAIRWDRTVSMFKFNLRRASFAAQEALIHKIKSGAMPKEWYPEAK